MKVALGMSGGVDSSTTAAYLLQAGHDVLGVTLSFMESSSMRENARDAAEVCRRLGIGHVEVDCTVGFASTVVGPFIEAYAEGSTPSPCVICNAGCKIPFLIKAADAHGCEKVATGHYARIARLEDGGRYVVKRALDDAKDQSYMLSMLSQDQLGRLFTPLGGTTKLAVRADAAEYGLAVADKPESQDICFIEGSYGDFLSLRGVADRPGHIVDADGNLLGRHAGLFRYTIGQRHGIGVAADRPYYVIGKDIEGNRLIVGFEEQTLIDEVVVTGVNWQAFAALDGPLECGVRLRYRASVSGCIVEPYSEADGDAAAVSLDASSVRVRLISPQPTTAPGQFAVFSLGDTVLGGGSIAQVRRAGSGDDRQRVETRGKA